MNRKACVITIVNVGYRSTNFWVVSNGTTRLLVDLGWPGTMGTMRANLKRAGVPLSEIRYGFATHYHRDHAGLAQELKNAGVLLLMMDVQVEWAPMLATLVKPANGYVDVSMPRQRDDFGRAEPVLARSNRVRWRDRSHARPFR